MMADTLEDAHLDVRSRVAAGGQRHGSFDSSRSPNPHLDFGHGIHFCPGAPLARLEGKLAVGDLLQRLHGFRRASAEPWEPRRGAHVHGPSRLPICFEPGRVL
jgi:cytochrome P450